MLRARASQLRLSNGLTPSILSLSSPHCAAAARREMPAFERKGNVAYGLYKGTKTTAIKKPEDKV